MKVAMCFICSQVALAAFMAGYAVCFLTVARGETNREPAEEPIPVSEPGDAEPTHPADNA